MKTGIELIADERQRQIDVEGYSAQHDSQHKASEFAYAIIAYAEAAKAGINCRESGITDERFISMAKSDMGRHFPWGEFKTTTDIRDLTKVGALAAALIDRLQGEQKSAEKVEPKFKVGDTIRLKNSNAEYIIESISDSHYYGKGFSISIVGGNRDYELVEQKPAWSEEDERIRKALIQIFNVENFENYGIKNEEVIAWLKKQGEQPKKNDVCNNCDQQGSCVSPCPMKLVEKQGEQKPADKVEPKFEIEEGEWYICIRDLLDNYANRAFCKGYIYLSTQNGSLIPSNSNVPFKIVCPDTYFRHWTIQDAKDGDVLSYATDEEDLWIMIYRSLYEPYEGHVHYHALLVNNNFSDKGTCCICIDDLKPATNEQRDLLFQKMKESGYEWDAENKKLKKIKQKPAWSEEDENMIEAIEALCDDKIRFTEFQDVKEYTYSIKNWLKSLKDRVQPQPMQEWTAEDEEELKIALNTLEEAGQYSSAKWLKNVCLVPQTMQKPAWKPSEEQITVLHDVAAYIDNSIYPSQKDILVNLYLQLKKLMED